MSASPEYNGSAINAWFKEWSNPNLQLAKFLFKAVYTQEHTGRQGGEAAKEICLQLLFIK